MASLPHSMGWASILEICSMNSAGKFDFDPMELISRKGVLGIGVAVQCVLVFRDRDVCVTTNELQVTASAVHLICDSPNYHTDDIADYQIERS